VARVGTPIMCPLTITLPLILTLALTLTLEPRGGHLARVGAPDHAPTVATVPHQPGVRVRARARVRGRVRVRARARVWVRVRARARATG